MLTLLLILPLSLPAQIVMGMFVNYFFAGFILGKVPFQLSPSFRPMLQRGIELPSLDVTYFTSLSFYILLLFGLRGVFMLVFRFAFRRVRATAHSSSQNPIYIHVWHLCLARHFASP